MKAPGKHYRRGMTLMEIVALFPDEAAAEAWFVESRWPAGRSCPKCGATNTREVPNARPMPYRCPDCRSYFSVRTGTAFERSKVPLRKWAIAIYLELTSLKSVSSMKLHRDIGVRQATAWFMLHRIRESWVESDSEWSGPVEVDETYMGGVEKNKHADKRHRKWSATEGKTIVLGAKDRETNRVNAEVVDRANKATVHAFLAAHTAPDATIYTDEGAQYRSIPYAHHSVNHKRAEYVRGDAHTNGIESFWAMLKRAHKGTFHKMSPKHMHRYVNEFAGKHNVRELDTIDQMHHVIGALVGKRLTYAGLIADNGLPSGARSA